MWSWSSFGSEGETGPLRHPIHARSEPSSAPTGGTLFFDEIADMPFETQGKIARALQAHTFEREGGTQQIEVDIRVMAATTRDMETEIEEGRFREDLYYRLLVTPIEVPALRDRREDIPDLASSFIQSGSGKRRGASAARLAATRWRNAAILRLAGRMCVSSGTSWNGSSSWRQPPPTGRSSADMIQSGAQDRRPGGSHRRSPARQT